MAATLDEARVVLGQVNYVGMSAINSLIGPTCLASLTLATGLLYDITDQLTTFDAAPATYVDTPANITALAACSVTERAYRLYSKTTIMSQGAEFAADPDNSLAGALLAEIMHFLQEALTPLIGDTLSYDCLDGTKTGDAGTMARRYHDLQVIYAGGPETFVATPANVTNLNTLVTQINNYSLPALETTTAAMDAIEANA
jgi:hypothetical protein